MREKRSTIQKRKQRIFLAVVILGVLAAIAGLMTVAMQKKKTHQKGEGTATTTQGSSDTISYNGKTYRYNDHLSNFLFLGVDTRQEQQEEVVQGNAGQADAIFLVSMDRVEQTVQVLLIPRDTMTTIEVYNPSGKHTGSTTDHINIQYAYGDGGRQSCELMKEAVSKMLYQIPIQNYAAINMDGIPVLTELVGGVELTVPDNSLAAVNPAFTEGAVVTLNKENTEQFVRYRDIEQGQSAIYRMNRQKAFLQAYMEKVQQIAATDPGIVTRLYEGMKPYLTTNMGNDLFVDLLEASQKGVKAVATLPGEGVSAQEGEGSGFDEYHLNDDGLYDLLIRTFYEEVEE